MSRSGINFYEPNFPVQNSKIRIIMSQAMYYISFIMSYKSLPSFRPLNIDLFAAINVILVKSPVLNTWLLSICICKQMPKVIFKQKDLGSPVKSNFNEDIFLSCPKCMVEPLRSPWLWRITRSRSYKNSGVDFQATLEFNNYSS